MKVKKILIIDDEHSLLESLEMFLTEKGYSVACAMSAEEGLKQSQLFDPQVIILDIRLPDMNGLDVLEEFIRNGRKNIVIITAFHDMDITIKAMKLGALDYIPKPIDVEELETVIYKAFKSADPSRMAETILIDPSLAYVEGKIIGKSRGMKEIFKTIGVLSENRVTVLIEGETGTGKELIARAIHYNSPFKEHPFRAINCSTIVGTLLESELFGHEKGSFTGASVSKKGKFELAGHGSIFLDEIGEIPYELQAKLLRFLQEKEFERLGGEKRIKSNARVIAATNRNLWEMVQTGSFREDFYYRLNVAAIKVPPLRERKQDIPLLVEHILSKINHELGKSIRKVEGEALKRIMEYEWPGNVRELENVMTNLLANFDNEKNELRKKIEAAPATSDVVKLMDSYLSRIHSDMGGMNFQKSRNLGYLLEIVRYAVKTLITVDKNIHNESLRPQRIQTESPSKHFVTFAKTVQLGICIALLAAFFSVEPAPWILVLLVIILMGTEIYLLVFNRKAGSKFKKHPELTDQQQFFGMSQDIDSKPRIAHPQSFLNYIADSLSYVDKAMNEQTPEKDRSCLEKETQILRLFQDMFEARAFNDGEWALKKITQIQAILREHGIIVKEYDSTDPSDILDFDVEPCADPSVKEYMTISPALLKGKRVLLRGRVAEPLT